MQVQAASFRSSPFWHLLTARRRYRATCVHMGANRLAVNQPVVAVFATFDVHDEVACGAVSIENDSFL